jgi:outer membrane lipoprotein-sorting protein
MKGEDCFKMKSLGYIVFISLVMVLNGCATVGPSPANTNYKQAVESLSNADDAIDSITASWYTNVLLGDMKSFHNPSILGRLFVTPEKLIFVVYDEATNSFLQTYEVVFSDITWLTSKEHGVMRIIRFQANNTVQSFIFGGWAKEEGQKLEKDQIVEYILGRVKSKKN